MDPTLLIPILFGWLSGLFVNYISDVLPVTRRFSQPDCPHCQTTFSWRDYLTLHTCRSCGKGRSIRTWLVQLLGVASFIYFWLFPSKWLGFWLGAIVLIYFAIITVIDLEHRLILHVTSMVGAVLGVVVGTHIYNTKYNLLSSFGQSLLGGIIGFGVMFLLYQIGAVIARYRARRLQAAGQADDEEEALGGGDVFLLGIIGLMVGWKNIIYPLVYGAFLGGLVSIVLIAFSFLRRRASSEALMTFIPYGPYFIVVAFYFLFIG